MTVPPAALPGHNLPTAPVEYVDAPGRHDELGCPACGAADQLDVTYPATVTVRSLVTRIDSVSRPETRTAGDARADLVPNARATKVACGNCRWSYEGPDPIGRLRPVDT